MRNRDVIGDRTDELAQEQLPVEEQITDKEISLKVLKQLKKDAEKHLKQKVQKAVITVPIFYDEEQRQNVKDLATEAGLEVLQFMDEPRAAIQAYGLDKLDKDKTIAVLDIGARTFDVTILKAIG